MSAQNIIRLTATQADKNSAKSFAICGVQCVKLFLIMVLAIVCSNAMAVMSSDAKTAAWKKIDGLRSSDFYYFDPISIRKNGSRAQISTLVNLDERQYIKAKEYVSVMHRTEYDCKNEKWRLLESHFFTEPMGSGEAVVKNSRSTAEWMPIPPGTPTELNMRIACVERQIVEQQN